MEEGLMKKTFVLLMILLLSVVTVASAGAPVKSNAHIELLFWSHYGESPPFVHAFAEIGTKLLKANGYPNATVKSEVIPYEGFEQKYLAAFASGKGPDIFVAMAPSWALEGGLNPIAVPLPDDVAKLWDGKLAPFLASWGTYKGKRYGFAAEGIMQMLYINTDHFKEAGLDPNKPPRTIDEFVATAKKLTKYDANGKVIRSGYHPRYLGHGFGVADKFLPIVHIFGGRMLSEDYKKATGFINSPESVAAFQFYYDLVYKHKVVNLDFGKPEPAFQQGLTSMIFREGWFGPDTIEKAPNIKFQVVPYIAGAKDYAPSNLLTWSNMISKNSKHKDVAFDLFRLLASVEGDVGMHKPAGYPPVLSETFKPTNEYFKSLVYGQALQESLKKQVGPEYHHPKIEAIAYIVGEEIAACLKGTAPKAAADKTARRIDEVLSGF
jgi:ABC-type glycerol-3-phosphate transport system substrate-binding protein